MFNQLILLQNLQSCHVTWNSTCVHKIKFWFLILVLILKLHENNTSNYY